MGEGELAVSKTSMPDWLPRRLLSVREASELLRVSERQLRRLIADGRLRVARVGRRVLITPESIIDLLKDK
jgi:excisionase family DNA binding protein